MSLLLTSLYVVGWLVGVGLLVVVGIIAIDIGWSEGSPWKLILGPICLLVGLVLLVYVPRHLRAVEDEHNDCERVGGVMVENGQTWIWTGKAMIPITNYECRVP